jgi:hypothetical protein
MSRGAAWLSGEAPVALSRPLWAAGEALDGLKLPDALAFAAAFVLAPGGGSRGEELPDEALLSLLSALAAMLRSGVGWPDAALAHLFRDFDATSFASMTAFSAGVSSRLFSCRCFGNSGRDFSLTTSGSSDFWPRDGKASLETSCAAILGCPQLLHVSLSARFCSSHLVHAQRAFPAA